MANPPYDGPWPRVRKAILERDGYRCQIRGPRCAGAANVVDHIVPVTQGGAWYEPSNLRAACQPCNRDRVDQCRSTRWRSAKTRIVLVVGPPCSGLSEYVDEVRGADDLVVDYETIARSLGATNPVTAGPLHPAVMAVRNALIRTLEQGSCTAARAWLTSTNPRAEGQFPHHEVVDLGGRVGQEECLRRNESQGGRGDSRRLAELIREWFAARSTGSAESASPPSRSWGG